MKKSFSKRILSVLLSVLMIVTTIPAFTITAQAADVSANLNRNPSLNKYIYAYFSGNQGCHLRFAVSDDGYNFEALNGGNNIATETADKIITFPGVDGKGDSMGNQKGIRDPFIIRKQDNSGFYIIATDLDTSYSKNPGGSGNEYNNTNILVWDIASLSDISKAKPWSVDLSGWYPEHYGTDKTDGFLGIGNTRDYYNNHGVSTGFCSWAPEVIWDAAKSMYMMYWSGPMYNDLRIHYVYTSDFRTFQKKDGTVLDGVSSARPDILYDPGYVSIDGNINYDKATNKYYMYYKNEQPVRDGNAKTTNLIHRVIADSPSGPYSNDIVIDTASNGCEGPEVYQLIDGSYIFMADNFSQGTEGGRFVMYKSDTLEGLTGGSAQFVGEAVSINHLMPSHGAVSYITTEEYNQLIDTYGVSNFKSPALANPKDVNDYLVARYFTTTDVTEDATGNGYRLTENANLTVESSETDNKTNYAVFKGNGVLTKDYKNASYGVVNTTNMLNDYNFSAENGVTFSWSAKSTQTGVGYGAFYTQVQSGVAPGGLTYDSKNNSHFKTAHSFVYAGKPTFSAAGSGVGKTIYGSENTIDDVTSFTNGWHDYTVTYTKGFMNLFIDGKLYNRYVTASGAIREGSPLAVSSMNDDWFKQIFTGNLYFGATAFGGQDKMFDGAISDFRIYSKALNQDEIKMSTRLINAEKIAAAVEKYESNMASDSFIRTNYAETYKAYMDCKKAYDALTYGDVSNGALDTEINYDELITTLNDRINDSTRFTTAGTVNVYDANNNDNPIDQKYSNKLLYYGGRMVFKDKENVIGEVKHTETEKIVGRTSTVENYYKIVMSDFVMLYDGDDMNLPTAPVQLTYEYAYTKAWPFDGTKPKNIYYALVDNPQFKIQKWLETGNTGTWQESNNNNAKFEMDETHFKLSNTVDTAKDNITNIGSETSAQKWTGNNYVTLNPSEVSFPADGSAAKIDTSFSIYGHKYGDSNAIRVAKISASETTNDVGGENSHYHSNYGYVVNYVPVKEAQQKAMQYIQSVKDYQVDNTKMLALLQAIDDSTAINLIGCFTGTTNVEQSANTAQKMVNDAAKAITDAIEALKVKTEDKYQQLRDVIPTAKRVYNAANTHYTTESFAQFKKMFEDAQALMNDVYGTNATHTDANNYNYNDRAGVIAEALNYVLNDLMDVTELRTTLETKASIYNDKGEQVSTLSSWLANKDKIQKGQTDLVTLGKAPKYPTTRAEYIALDGTTVYYDRVDKSSTNDNQVKAAVEEVKTIALEPIDNADAYTNFDNVCAVVDAMDRAKYTDEALAAIDALYAKLNTEVVYATPSDEAAQLYMAINGVDISRRKLYNTTRGETDPATISLLELVNVDDKDPTKVNHFTAYLSVKVENGTESAFEQYGEIKPYGDMFTIDVADKVQDGDKVTWSALLYKKGDGAKAVAGEKVEPIGTQKISNYTGSVLQRKADCDFVVTAKITRKNPSVSEKIVKIYNGYGNLLDVKYVASEADVKVNGTELIVGTETIGEPKLPFYTLTRWTVSPAGDTIYVNPVYNTVDLKTITVNGGTAEGLNGDKAAVTNYVTLTADDANAHGWAVKNGDKYQIVGYSNVYSFLVFNDETYYPILNANGSYTVNGEVLTAAMVEGFQNNTANKMSDDDFLKVKLDNKAPFVYNQTVNGRTHYYRITANCSEAVLKAHGMHVLRPDGKEANFASTTQNVGGQYSMSMKNDSVGYSFNGYITYEFKYNFKGVDYTLNTTEYTSTVNS